MRREQRNEGRESLDVSPQDRDQSRSTKRSKQLVFGAIQVLK